MSKSTLVQLKKLKALADTGLVYSESGYDRDRYDQIKQITLDLMGEITNTPVKKLTDFFLPVKEYPTVKVDVRGFVLNEKDEILMAKESVDGKWTIPGGWADIGDTPSEAVLKEIKEETGFNSEIVSLLAIYDKRCHPHPPETYYIYKLMFFCKITGGELAHGFDMQGAGFFPLDELPELSKDRILKSQLEHLFQLAKNGTNLAKKIDAVSEDVDLIVLPEMFTTGFTMTPENLKNSDGKKTVLWMQEMAKSKNSAVVGSIPYQENNEYTNRLFFVGPSGETYQYDKRHTFTLAGEDKVYKSGNERLIVDFKGFRICPLICYDLRFPVWSRYNNDYDVLLYVANWPEPRISAWDSLLKARAIENMAYCIGVNRIGKDANNLQYPGHSAVYDPLGNQLVFSETEKVIYGSLSIQNIEEARDKLKFLADRDEFSLK